MKEPDNIFLFGTGFNDMRHNFTSSVPSRLDAVWSLGCIAARRRRLIH